MQWWIQDFPDGERQPLVKAQKTIIWQGFLLKNCVKIKEIGLGGTFLALIWICQ